MMSSPQMKAPAAARKTWAPIDLSVQPNSPMMHGEVGQMPSEPFGHRAVQQEVSLAASDHSSCAHAYPPNATAATDSSPAPATTGSLTLGHHFCAKEDLDRLVQRIRSRYHQDKGVVRLSEVMQRLCEVLQVCYF